MVAQRDARMEHNRPTARPWLGALLGLAVLAALVAADFLAARKYPLISYYAVAPLFAAATMGPLSTAAVGCVAVGAGLLAGHFDDRNLLATQEMLQIGSVAVISLIAVAVAALRQRREQQMSEIVNVADTAQRAILRTASMTLPGLRLASAYHSASGGADVGGDLVETVSGPLGRRLILGDVAGKGLGAVQLAATVLGAFRLSALNRAELTDVAYDLDQVVTAFGAEEEFVTALIAQFGIDDIQLICCGHHPPLLGPPAGLVPIEISASPPLGLGGARRVASIPWHPGDLLVAYTDGVVEARDPAGRMVVLNDVVTGIRTSRPAAAVQHIAEQVLRHTAGRLDDDLAVLAVTQGATDRSDQAVSQTIDLEDTRRQMGSPWAERIMRALPMLSRSPFDGRRGRIRRRRPAARRSTRRPA